MKEHINSVKYNRSTAFGQHMFDENHKFTNLNNDMTIVKTLKKGVELNTREAAEIYLSKNDDKNLNEQNPYGDNVLFSCLRMRT